MQRDIDMEMNHFSNQHPLILQQVPEKSCDGNAVICYGCQQEILEPQANKCLPCHDFPHKKCAELPEEITHPMHSEHPLLLAEMPPCHDGKCLTDACYLHHWKFFAYSCSVRRFDLHLQRPAPLRCNPCCARHQDSSCACRVCPSSIHKTCPTLPKVINYKLDHNHSLSLSYTILHEHRSHMYCAVCKDETRPNYWCYCCSSCEYFVHIKCLDSHMVCSLR